jgi:hypothetical protein
MTRGLGGVLVRGIFLVVAILLAERDEYGFRAVIVGIGWFLIVTIMDLKPVLERIAEDVGRPYQKERLLEESRKLGFPPPPD